MYRTTHYRRKSRNWNQRFRVKPTETNQFLRWEQRRWLSPVSRQSQTMCLVVDIVSSSIPFRLCKSVKSKRNGALAHTNGASGFFSHFFFLILWNFHIREMLTILCLHLLMVESYIARRMAVESVDGGCLTWKAVNCTMNAHDRTVTFFNILHFSDGDTLTFSLIDTVSSVPGGGCNHITTNKRLMKCTVEMSRFANTLWSKWLCKIYVSD